MFYLSASCAVLGMCRLAASGLCCFSNMSVSIATKGAAVFYTLNGTRPDPFQRLGRSDTFAYTSPFTLPPGRVTIKALAASQDRLHLSGVVTKEFSVKPAPPGSEGGLAYEDVSSLLLAHSQHVKACLCFDGVSELHACDVG